MSQAEQLRSLHFSLLFEREDHIDISSNIACEGRRIVFGVLKAFFLKYAVLMS
ncbi:hypothetical protein SCG7086_AZ_00030 [Chlamydiales bacterium SCGC AG-110-P3]|nr:hypothetical protein SCG7086_AZ_00030 [Chlamydiales bacterium SCGC AG-110-P3]